MTPIGNIRLAGINERFERVQFFMNHAERYEDPIDKFRFEMAAIYSCRAISELMLEAADKQETCDPKSPDAKITRSDLEGLIATGGLKAKHGCVTGERGAKNTVECIGKPSTQAGEGNAHCTQSQTVSHPKISAKKPHL